MCELSEFGRKSIWNIVIVHIKCNILYICMQKELQITRWLTLGHLLYPLRWSVNFNHVYHDKINQYKIMITNSAKELVSFTFWKSNNMRLKRIYTLILFSKNVVVREYLKLIPRFISCKYKCIVLCTLRGKAITNKTPIISTLWMGDYVCRIDHLIQVSLAFNCSTTDISWVVSLLDFMSYCIYTYKLFYTAILI